MEAYSFFFFFFVMGLIWVSVMIVLLLAGSVFLGRRIGVSRLLKIAAVVFVSLEIIKYLFLIETFEISYLPIQFCSLMLYAYPLAAFTKGRIREAVLPFAYVAGLMAGLITLLMPTNILGDPALRWLTLEDTFPLWSFIYHGFMVYYSLYLAVSGAYVPRWRHVGNVAGFSVFFSLVAVGLNALWDTDFMMLNEGVGNPLNGLLEVGWIWYYLLHLVLMALLSVSVIGVTKGIRGIILWMRQRNEAAEKT